MASRRRSIDDLVSRTWCIADAGTKNRENNPMQSRDWASHHPTTQDLVVLFVQCTPKPSNDDTTCTVVCGGLNAIVDVEDEFRHVVVPVEPDHRLRRQPSARRAVE